MSAGTKVAEGLGLGTFRHVGIVVKNTDKVKDYYEKTLGIGHFSTFEVQSESLRGKAKLRISFAVIGGTQFEIVEVLEGKDVHSDFLDQDREGLHHLAFYCGDIDKKLKELQKKNIKVLERELILGRNYAYLDTEAISGVIFELV